MIRYGFTACLLLALGITSCCKLSNNNILIKIGTREYPEDILYKDLPPKKFAELPENEKGRIVTKIAQNKLMLYDAYKEGFQHHKIIRKKLKQFYYKNSYDFYLNRIIIDSIIPESKIVAEYAKLDPYYKEYNPYSYYSPKIKAQLIRKNQAKIEQAYRDHIKNLYREYRIEYFPENIKRLAEILSTYQSYQSNSHRQSLIDQIENINFEEPLFSMDGRQYGTGWIIRNSQFYPYQNRNRIEHYEILKNIFESVIINRIVLDRAESLQIGENPDFTQQRKEYREKLIIDLYKKNKIGTRIQIDSININNFYHKYKDSLYATKPLYEVQVIYVADEAQAWDILEKARGNPEDFENLSEQYTEQFVNRKPSGYLGYISSNLYSSIGKTAARTPAGSIHPEPVPYGKGFTIIRVLDIKPRKPKDLVAVRAKVVRDLKNNLYTIAEMELIETLKNRYNLRIDWSVLNMNPDYSPVNDNSD